jgi:hypothetical protein
VINAKAIEAAARKAAFASKNERGDSVKHGTTQGQPTAWLITRAATQVLAVLPPEDRATLLADPTTSVAWHVFRDQLHQLDREHGSRQSWLFAGLPDHARPGDSTTHTHASPRADK